MRRAPITRQRSPWVEQSSLTIDGVKTWVSRREVGDGKLLALVAEEPQGWHLSISFRDHLDRLTRYPRWDEIAHARDELLPNDVDFVMWLPRTADYVALHDTTFHLHEHPERQMDVHDGFLADRRDWLRVETVDRGDGAWDVVLVIDGTYTRSAEPSKRAEMIDYFTRWLADELP